MYWSAGLVALVPPAVVTVTSTAPAEAAGATATICVAVLLLTVAVLLPNLTAVAFARFAPVIVTLVPPAVGPEVGLIAATDGPLV